MQKIILLICAVLMISTVANACGGITITGKSGKSYCLSKFTMNWYTAYAWCKDQSMDLIELGTTCGTNVGTCSELALSSDEQNNIKEKGITIDLVWTNTSNSASYAYYVNLSSGNFYNLKARSVNGDYALCYESPLPNQKIR